MKAQAFQVKFLVSRPKMRSVTCSGIVLAMSRQEGVFEATKTMRETVDTMEKGTKFKLVSAMTIPNDFFIMHPDVLNKVSE